MAVVPTLVFTLGAFAVLIAPTSTGRRLTDRRQLNLPPLNILKDDYKVPRPPRRPTDCPLCDSSVFSYCSDKLLHDACCCLRGDDSPLPYQCHYADCSFLHSNTCREHSLITRCCCSRLIYIKKLI